MPKLAFLKHLILKDDAFVIRICGKLVMGRLDHLNTIHRREASADADLLAGFNGVGKLHVRAEPWPPPSLPPVIDKFPRAAAGKGIGTV